MRKQLLLFLLSCIIAPLSTQAFKLESLPTDSIIPTRTIERDETGITVSYTFSGAVMMSDDLYPDRVRLEILGFGRNLELEQPEWPVRIDSFEIPEGYDTSVSVVSANWCKLDISLSPSRPLLEDRSGVIFSLDNVPPVKDFVGTLPANPVAIHDHQIYRDRHILYVEVLPIKCIDNKETMVCEKLIYRINFIPSKLDKKKDPNKIRHEVDEEYMRSLYSSVIPKVDSDDVQKYASSASTHWKQAPYYLILSSPEYKVPIDSLTEWKN